MKDGRIVGFGKSGNGLAADASMLDVASAVPVNALGFTEEDIEKIFDASEDNRILYQFSEVPPGSVYDNEESFMTPVVVATYFTDQTAMEEEVQYRATKAMFEVLEDAAVQTNYGGAMGITPPKTPWIRPRICHSAPERSATSRRSRRGSRRSPRAAGRPRARPRRHGRAPSGGTADPAAPLSHPLAARD